LVSNPAFSRDALSPTDAILLLAANLAHPNHELWVEDISVPAAVEAVPRPLQGHQQLTDAYLLALANHHRGVLVTFDRGMEALAAGWATSALELVRSR
jgi:predicted nucleic acid-binding protein